MFDCCILNPVRKIIKIIISLVMVVILGGLFVLAFDPWERANKKTDESTAQSIRGYTGAKPETQGLILANPRVFLSQKDSPNEKICFKPTSKYWHAKTDTGYICEKATP